MKIQYGSVFGNYRWTATAEIADELLPTLASFGALQIAQRSPSTAAEKEMAGYEKRPEKFQRNSIPFDVNGAEILREQLSTMKVGDTTITANVEVEEYVPTEVDVKMADERAAYARNAKQLEKLAAKVGFSGTLGDGTKEGAPVDFLRAIRAWTKAQLAALEA